MDTAAITLRDAIWNYIETSDQRPRAGTIARERFETVDWLTGALMTYPDWIGDQTFVTVRPGEQGLYLLLGDNTVVTVYDNVQPGAFESYSPVMRAVWGARLRALADVLDPATGDESVAAP